jgi:hypothetical protein
MLIKITFQLIILIFSTVILRAQYFESIEKEAERILISLSEGDSLNPSNLITLKNLLYSEINDDVAKSYPDFNSRSIDSLTNHLAEFESELKNISTDSAFILFNNWYLHLQNIFYDYSKEKFYSSNKTKILFFSTSMSCYCTMKMSRIQTTELLKFVSDEPGKYDYWVIDSYWFNELQIKYETLFAPSVLVFDGSNQLLYKIEYEEKMLTQLTDHLDKVKN